jgi:hypothetical protein
LPLRQEKKIAIKAADLRATIAVVTVNDVRLRIYMTAL